MTTISKRTIATMLLLAAAIGLGGTWMMVNQQPGGITSLQFATDYGSALLTINAVGSIRFAVNTTNFGTGRVNTTGGNQACVLDSRGTNELSKCVNFTTVNGGFQIENNGDVNVSVQLYFSNNASGFIGGDDTIGKYRYNVSQNETNSCRNSTGGTGCVSGENCTIAPVSWSEVNTTSLGTTICPKLLTSDLTDSLLVDINITIPYDAPAGSKLSTLTATATSAS